MKKYRLKVKVGKKRVTIIRQQEDVDPLGRVCWQDIERTWLTVDQVYETRWDCMAVPGGARKVA